MSNIEKDKLIKLGATDAQVTEITDFLNTYEELSSATAEELVTLASSLDLTIAGKIITFASLRAKGAAKLAVQENISVPPVNVTPQVQNVAQNPLAAFGFVQNAMPVDINPNNKSKLTTFVPKRQPNSVSELVGGQPLIQTMCTACNLNIDIWLQSEPGLTIDDLKICPHCSRKVTKETPKKCYRCKSPYPTSGNVCVRCAARVTDSERKKAATLWMLHKLNKSVAEVSTNVYNEQSITDEEFEIVKRENWIYNVEDGNGLIPADGGERPASTNAGRSFRNS